MILKPRLLLFDVYETLLDMSLVEKRINQALDSKRGYIIWFELFMQYCFVDNNTDQFNDFRSIADATLRMTHRILRRDEDTHNINEILELLKHLPIKDGVQEGLSDLYDQNYRIAALTNSPEHIVTQRMERTGLISYFETILSAEHVKKYKPAKEVYTWAAGKLQLRAGDILMVTTHGWDIAGAENAGMRTAYIEQSREMLYPLAPTPEFRCKTLPDLNEQLQLRFAK